MKILIIGGTGRIGRELQEVLTDNCAYLSSRDLDITNALQLKQTIETMKPSIIINLSTHMNVDKTEFQIEEKIRSFEVNITAVSNLSKLCNDHDIFLIHFSTDYVFSGYDDVDFYTEESSPCAINYHGLAKLTGEKEIMRVLKKYLIIRTSWVYGKHKYSFIDQVLERATTDQLPVKVVSDQWGSPTNATDLCQFILFALSSQLTGVVHFANEGMCSRYMFAQKAYELLYERSHKEIYNPMRIVGVPSKILYPCAAPRPFKCGLKSVLHKFPNRSWEAALKDYLEKSKIYGTSNV